MNRPGKATRSHGKPSDDDDETTGLGLPVSLKRQIESYAVMHHMTPTQVLAEGVKLLLKQEVLQQGRMNRAKPKARPCNKPFDAEERQYLCGLDAVDECGEKRITWNRYFIRYVEYELELGARPVDVRNPPFWTATIPHTHPGRPDGRPTGECGTRPFWTRPSRFASCNLRTGRRCPERPSPWYGDATPYDQAKASGRTGIGVIILPAAGRPCGCGWPRPSNRAGGATHLYARRPPPTLRRDADPCQWTRRIGRNEAKPDLQSTKVTRAEWKRNGYGGLHVYGNRPIGHFPLVSQ